MKIHRILLVTNILVIWTDQTYYLFCSIMKVATIEISFSVNIVENLGPSQLVDYAQKWYFQNAQNQLKLRTFVRG